MRTIYPFTDPILNNQYIETSREALDKALTDNPNKLVGLAVAPQGDCATIISAGIYVFNTLKEAGWDVRVWDREIEASIENQMISCPHCNYPQRRCTDHLFLGIPDCEFGDCKHCRKCYYTHREF